MSEATSSLYFYMAGGERRGPFPFDQLLQQPVHRETRVWCKGMSDWQAAQAVPELAGLLPPVPPVGPPSVRRNAATKKGVDLNRYANALCRLNYGLLVLIAASLILSVVSGHTFGVLYVLVAVAWVVILGRAALAVPVRLPWLWAIVGVLPLIGYVPLIMLHNRLKCPLERAGYRISFLGRAAAPAEGVRSVDQAERTTSPLPTPAPKPQGAIEQAAPTDHAPEQPNSEPLRWRWLGGIVGLFFGAVFGPAATLVTLAIVSATVGRGGQGEWAVWVVALLPPLFLAASDSRNRETFGLLSTGSAAAGYYLYKEYADRLHSNMSVVGCTEPAPWVAIVIWGLVGTVAGVQKAGELRRVFGRS